MIRAAILAAFAAAVLLAALVMALTLEGDAGWNGWRHTINGE